MVAGVSALPREGSFILRLVLGIVDSFVLVVVVVGVVVVVVLVVLVVVGAEVVVVVVVIVVEFVANADSGLTVNSSIF